ncbi:hypothetical protein LSTR_LSTR005062 [Laodelphax striatellus]|uniref:Uncharacterized protein n=1 Tax=Laodelphax striatellus TaxID=195883 RepID=A0A482WT07_LAOST|nr:hypothetical protein LSTR_LSTR005062 [Laodelphax striatellus]
MLASDSQLYNLLHLCGGIQQPSPAPCNLISKLLEILIVSTPAKGSTRVREQQAQG